eukprot:4980761-Prorocentrum_lima.AAC.1
MKRVLNTESGPDLTICSAAELSFRTLAMVYFGIVLPSSVADVFHSGYLRPYPPILLHMMIG